MGTVCLGLVSLLKDNVTLPYAIIPLTPFLTLCLQSSSAKQCFANLPVRWNFTGDVKMQMTMWWEGESQGSPFLTGFGQY